MRPRIYYLAKHYDEYLSYVREHLLDRNYHIYLHGRGTQIMGIENPQIIRLEGYEFNQEMEDLIATRMRKEQEK